MRSRAVYRKKVIRLGCSAGKTRDRHLVSEFPRSSRLDHGYRQEEHLRSREPVSSNTQGTLHCGEMPHCRRRFATSSYQAASEDPDFDPCSADIERQRRNGSKIARIWNYEATFNANVKGVLLSRIYQLRVSVRLQSVFKRPAVSARTPWCGDPCRRTCLIASTGRNAEAKAVRLSNLG